MNLEKTIDNEFQKLYNLFMYSNAYYRIHSWINLHYGKATYCSFNKKHQSKRFHWALIKGKKHGKNINNYMPLCQPCHIKYDWAPERTARLKIFRLGNTNRRRALLQFDKSGNFVKRWISAFEVEANLRILRTSLANHLKGRSKTAGGFIWKYA